MPKSPNVRVRIDVRANRLMPKANGHPDTADISRARAHIYVEKTPPTHSLNNTTTTHPPYKDVRVSVAFCCKGFCPDTLPDTGFLACPSPAMARVPARTFIESRFS